MALHSANDSSSSDDDDDSVIDLMMAKYFIEHERDFVERIPYRTSMLSGKEYIVEVLLGNPTRCYESFRMAPHVFVNLCNRLKLMGLLKDNKNVSVEEGVAMGLAVLCHSTRQRLVAERFQHSTCTVHKWTKIVIKALATFGTHLIKYKNRGQVQPEIHANPKWYPYFEVCYFKFHYIYILFI